MRSFTDKGKNQQTITEKRDLFTCSPISLLVPRLQLRLVSESRDPLSALKARSQSFAGWESVAASEARSEWLFLPHAPSPLRELPETANPEPSGDSAFKLGWFSAFSTSNLGSAFLYHLLACNILLLVSPSFFPSYGSKPFKVAF